MCRVDVDVDVCVPSVGWCRKKKGLEFTPGLLLWFDVEDSRDEASKKRKRDDTVKTEKKEGEGEEEEADTVEELNADGESVAKKQKTKDGAANRPVAPELKIKQYFRQFGDVGYVELAEKHCSVRFKVHATSLCLFSRVVHRG